MARHKPSPIGCLGLGLGILWLNSQCGKSTSSQPPPPPVPYFQRTAQDAENNQRLLNKAHAQARRVGAASLQGSSQAQPQYQARSQQQRQSEQAAQLQRQAEEQAAQARFNQIRSQASYNSSALRGRLTLEQRPEYALQQQRRAEIAQWRQEQAKTVYVTATGDRYHAQACRHAGQARATTLAYAESSGLTPCAHCGGGLGL